MHVFENIVERDLVFLQPNVPISLFLAVSQSDMLQDLNSPLLEVAQHVEFLTWPKGDNPFR